MFKENNQPLPLLVETTRGGHHYEGYGENSYDWESGVFDWRDVKYVKKDGVRVSDQELQNVLSELRGL